MGREVGDHRPERGAEGADQGGDRTATGGRRLRGGLVGEGAHRHRHEPSEPGVAEPVLDDAVFGDEGAELVEAEGADRDLDELGLGNADRALLLGEVVPAGIAECRERDQADQLAPSHPHAARLGGAADFIESDVRGSDAQVHEVHRDLRDAVLLDEPPDRLHRLERAGAHHRVPCGVLDLLPGEGVPLTLGTPDLAHVEGDGVGATGGGGIEVHVECHQKVARPDDRGAALGVERLGAEVWGPSLFLHPPLEPFVFPGADDREVLPGRIGLRRFIRVDRDAEFFPDPFAEGAGVLRRLRHTDPRDRDQGADVRGAHPGMFAVVLPHVDQFGRFGDAAEGRLDHRRGGAGEGHHGAVSGLPRVHVQELGALDRLEPGGDAADDLRVAAFGEVRHAFDQGGHRGVPGKR